MAYVLFDIGGTKTRVAISYDLKTFGEKVKFDTPKNFDEGIAAIHEAVRSLTTDPIEAIGGGIRGPLNHEKTKIISEKTLTDWVEQPLAKALAEPYRAPVFIENDTAIVGLGEAHYGAGRGHDIVVYHTVSTGVGGVRIVGGVIDPSSQGFEPGHQILDIDETIEPDGQPDTLENLVSGTALEFRRGVKPYEIPQDDGVWPRLAKYLAYGLRNTVVYWSPDVIVLGGSMIIGDPRIMLEDIERETEAVLKDVVPAPAIVDAELGDEGGLYGAMVLINQRM
jgi:predicted NBD/HSP70 family sugar kinase